MQEPYTCDRFTHQVPHKFDRRKWTIRKTSANLQLTEFKSHLAKLFWKRESSKYLTSKFSEFSELNQGIGMGAEHNFF